MAFRVLVNRTCHRLCWGWGKRDGFFAGCVGGDRSTLPPTRVTLAIVSFPAMMWLLHVDGGDLLQGVDQGVVGGVNSAVGMQNYGCQFDGLGFDDLADCEVLEGVVECLAEVDPVFADHGECELCADSRVGAVSVSELGGGLLAVVVVVVAHGVVLLGRVS